MQNRVIAHLKSKGCRDVHKHRLNGVAKGAGIGTLPQCALACSTRDRDDETQHGSCLTQAQQHCNAVQPEQRATHVRELVRSLADWAETHKALNAVIQLPLNPLEEQVSAAAAASPCYPASDCTQ